MDINEAIGNIMSVRLDRSKVKLIDSYDWLDTFDMAIKALEAQQWIPVSERLPEKNGYVFAVFETCLPFIAMFYYDFKKFFCDGDEVNPTHWMPLPLAPEVE